MFVFPQKSSQSRPIAPAAASHAPINPSSHFLPHSFGAMYSQMPSIMMQPGMPFIRPEFPFARHIMPLQVSATASVQSRPSLGQPGRGHSPQISHHLKPGGLQNPMHAIPGMTVPVHPSTNLQQTRSPSPQPSPDTTTPDVPKGKFIIYLLIYDATYSEVTVIKAIQRKKIGRVNRKTDKLMLMGLLYIPKYNALTIMNRNFS